mgnify:CR=1 FL=1
MHLSGCKGARFGLRGDLTWRGTEQIGRIVPRGEIRGNGLLLKSVGVSVTVGDDSVG